MCCSSRAANADRCASLGREDELPRVSSRDFAEEEMQEGDKGLMDVTLGPGWLWGVGITPCT